MADLQQFRALVEPQLKRLYRMAWRLTGNRSDAEDLFQDTCLRAWERFPDPADPELIERWLFRVLYHRFVDDSRRRRSSPVGQLGQTVEARLAAEPLTASPEALAESDRYRRNDEDRLMPPAQVWPPEMLAALAEISVEARENSTRIVAVRELGRAGDAAYLDVLTERLRNDPDTGVRAAAAVALERYFAESPEARQALQELGLE